METGDEILQKSHVVARSAKAAMLLLSLKQYPDLCHLKPVSIDAGTQEKETMKKEIEDLWIRLTIERKKRLQAKRCGLLLLATQLALLISLWSLILVFAYSFF